jgi:two-component system, NarL family, response regulator DevR
MSGPQSDAAAGVMELERPIRVFLLDDHEIVRRGIADLFDHEPGMEVVGEASAVAGTLARIAEAAPDVALLDVRLPDGTGLELCRDIRSTFPGVRCIMLTSYDEADAIFAAVMAGADGYLLKEIRGTNLAGAVRTVAQGGTLLDPAVVDSVLAMLRSGTAHDTLTAREKELLDYVARGLTNRQIAEMTGMEERTVRAYVAGLIAKLTSHI